MAQEVQPSQSVGVVRTPADLDLLMEEVYVAQDKMRLLNQEQVDKIFHRAATAAAQHRVPLAKMAVEEGGMGILEDKTIKNHFASEYVHSKYKDTKTCGVVDRDEAGGFEVVAEPIGVLAGIVPCTNPTSTTIFKSLLALKTRNCIVFSPHPRTARCTIATAKIVRDAAVDAGAPENCIGWIDIPTVEMCNTLMQHKRASMVVATGAGGLVKAAYSSGKPAMGGGAGNTPAVIDETADIPLAVNSILLSKTFDCGMICASEQCVVAVESVAKRVEEEFTKRGAYFLTEEEKHKMGDFILLDGDRLNPKAVGQTAEKLCQMANIEGAPKGVRLCLGKIKEIGPSEKLSHEKLCPCLSFITVPDFDAAVEMAYVCVRYGGMGHTSCLYSDQNSKVFKDRLAKFESRMPTGRVLVDMPTSQGAIGDLYNFRTSPSLSLGCGSWGMNATAEGLSVKHLLNYKQVSERREHMLWFKVPPAIYFNRGILHEAMEDLQGYGLTKAFIVTDQAMKSLGYVSLLTTALERRGIDYDVFADVKPDPDDLTVMAGVERMKQYKPDCMIAFGGGSPMDASKIMRLVYEHPEVTVPELYTRFLDIRKRIIKFPNLGSKVKKLVMIPTTSGTGAEMTPFAVITDSKTHTKYPIASYRLTPDMAIMDGDFVQTMPKGLAAFTGYDAYTHALEAYVSMLSTDYTQALSLRAIKLIFDNLPKSVLEADATARENMHNASSIAGLAFANAFLGICHSIAHQLGGAFSIPHGLANALVLTQVVKFNASEAPTKLGTFPQYSFPKAQRQYAEVAEHIAIVPKDKSMTDAEKVDALVAAMEKLKEQLRIPKSIQEYGVKEDDYMAAVDDMALRAFDDQCTGTNPRYPLVRELKMILTDAYYGNIRNYEIGAE
ncbi:unnamed protein product [Vitrella brassicaformis CCMP3155]|uniref:Aldehyde-alcohol dehydrogenase n=1 Tax=Vitrella brassicaformis (strain CCMP3155) TaxID=1169540 RepID=A0A0G4EQY8_VITBC|nr:unnamed protein product [Vitrella brassicaformis CCMP3155]|mmetsp:Transcript_27955/g.69793  ORF Transcript_27955/g.69793 Transcript_27955/m.69793 type:complete len:891 (-) Transcript_27955:544-3216(-)|eukprot:CEL99899.1 unnamed protein product [Vitrella brassicaformis CCMP3155]